MENLIKPEDFDKYIDVRLTVAETKALINLLDDQHPDMIGYHNTKDLLIKILIDKTLLK